MSVTLTATLSDAEALALATVIRGLCPPDGLASAWYGALDKLSPQLPPTPDDDGQRLSSLPENWRP